MKTKVNHGLLGLGVIVMFGVLVLAIIWLASGSSMSYYSTYKVYVKESVSGLDLDSDVEFNGVQVGSIDSIELNATNPRVVDVLLNIKSDTPITRGTVGTLATRGLTGVVYFSLKDEGKDLRPVVIPPEESYPVIPSVPSLFTRLDSTLSELNASFKEISASFQELFSQDNIESMKQVFYNIQQVSQILSKNSAQLTEIVTNTEKAFVLLGPLMKSGKNTIQILQSQTMPAAYHLINNLEDLMRTVNDFTKNVKQNPSIIIRGIAPPAAGPGER